LGNQLTSRSRQTHMHYEHTPAQTAAAAHRSPHTQHGGTSRTWAILLGFHEQGSPVIAAARATWTGRERLASHGREGTRRGLQNAISLTLPRLVRGMCTSVKGDSIEMEGGMQHRDESAEEGPGLGLRPRVGVDLCFRTHGCHMARKDPLAQIHSSYHVLSVWSNQKSKLFLIPASQNQQAQLPCAVQRAKTFFCSFGC